VLLIPDFSRRISFNLDSLISPVPESPPLDIFFHNKYKLKLWLKIVNDFKKLIFEWTDFKFIRSKIEDLFNIAKNSLGMKQIHQYTKPSVEKKVARIIFLSQELIYLFAEQNIEKKANPFL
jgi:hypothetical protein